MPSIGKIWVEIGGNTSGLDKSLAKAVSNINKAGTQLSTAGRTLTLGVTVPIVAVGALAIKASMEFETAFAGVRKTVDGTAQDFVTLRKGILDMSTAMPETASNIAKIVETAGQLGIKTADLLDFAKTMVMVGKTTDVTADEAATGFARIANIMQLPAGQVKNLASAFTFLSNEGASTGREIIEMGQRIAGAGHAVGLTAPEVLAFSAGLSDLGLKAEAGGTAFSRMMITMAGAAANIKPTAEQLKAISDAQRNVRDTGEAMVGAQQQVRNAIESVGAASRGVRDAHEGVAAAQRTARDANERLTQAYRDLAQAQRDQRQASLDSRRETLSVAEAQQGLREVQAGGANQALELRAAEMSLREARQRGPKDIAEAEYALAKIRNQAKPDAQSLKDAERSLSKARSEDHSLEIAQAEQRLLEVRTRAPRHTLDLANAQLRLEETSIRVGDAQKRQDQNMQGANKSIRDAKEGVIDSARGIRDANERVVESDRGRRDASEAVTQAQLNARNASEKYREAQDALTLANDQATGKLKTFAEVAGMTPDAFATLFKTNPAQAINAFVAGLQRIQKEGGNLFPIFEKLELNDIRIRDELLRMAVGSVDFTKKLSDTNDEFGVAAYLTGKYAEVTDTAANKLQLQRNEINKNLIALGDQLVPALLSVTQNMQPLIAAFGTATAVFAAMPTPIQGVVIGFFGLVAVIGPAAMVIGNLTKAFMAFSLLMKSGVIVRGLMAMRVAFQALGMALLTPPLGIIIALIAIGVAIYVFRDEIMSVLAPSLAWAGKQAEAAGKAIIGAFEKVKSFVRDHWKEIAVLISGPFLPLVILATDAFGIRSALVEGLGSVIGFFRALPGNIISAVGSLKNLLWKAGGDVIKGLIDGIKSMIPNLSDILGQITGMIPMGKGPPAVDRQLLEPSGRMIMQGLANGLTTGFDTSVSSALAAVTSNIGEHNIPSPVMGRGMQGVTGLSTGGRSVGESSPIGAGAGGGFNMTVSGPVTVKNIGRKQDAKGALGALGYGIRAQMTNVGQY